jgi:PE family
VIDMPMLPDGENVGVRHPVPPEDHSENPHPVPLNATLDLQVELDQVDEVARIFEDNAARLDELSRQGQIDLQMRPMAEDEVSVDGATGFTEAGKVHLEAIRKYQKWLLAIAGDLRASAAKYRSSEAAVAGDLRGVSGG